MSSNRDGARDPAMDRRMPAVTTWVPRFLNHRVGHTVYECVVELPHTRQLWVVYKRYGDFVALREKVKTACEQQKALTPPLKPKPINPAKRLHGEGDGRIRAQKKPAEVSPVVAADPTLAKRVKKLMSEHRFPRKIPLGRSVALKQERRRALHAFLRALVQLRPLPQAVATFLGLLEDNRIGVDQYGHYVRVMHANNVLPIPKSPTRARPRAKEKSSRRSGSSISKNSNNFPISTQGVTCAGGKITTPTEAALSATISPTSTADLPTYGGRSCEQTQRPTMGSRAEVGVSNVEMAILSSATAEGKEGKEWSDSEDPTDSESDMVSDSDPDESFETESRPSGFDKFDYSKLGNSKHDSGEAAPDETTSDKLEAGRNDRAVAAEGGEERDESDLSTKNTTPEHGAENVDTSRLYSRIYDDSGTASGSWKLSRPGPPSARLRGGGGGGGPGGDDEEGKLRDGWSFVESEAGEIREREEVDEERGARMLQWEFVNGYLEEVVSKVVARLDLTSGMEGALGGGSNDKKTNAAGETQSEAPEEFLAFILPMEERNIRMAELQSLGVDLPTNTLISLLRYKDWGPEAATALYQDLVAAGKGLLEKVTPGNPIRGMENGGNTCYIDSLLFSMFATLDAFDWLLLKPLPATEKPELKLLQKHLRFLVNQLRQGAVIPREHSNLIRNHLRFCGWQGGTSTQEDVTELFTFLVILLRCPALPLSEALFHGGSTDAGDSRISTERALYLALPEEKEAGSSAASAASAQPACHSDWSLDAGGVHSDGKGSGATGSAVSMAGKGVHGDNRGGGVRAGAPLAVTLEQILMYNFYDNRVEGLRRTVSGEKESKPVDAWRMVSMLPFYSLSGEFAEESDPSNDKHFDTIILPMVLKRYEIDQPTTPTTAKRAGPSTKTQATVTRKSRRNINVPHRLDCSKFMVPAEGGKGGSADGSRFVLVLRSAVCHIGGEKVSEGHYVAYSADSGVNDLDKKNENNSSVSDWCLNRSSTAPGSVKNNYRDAQELPSTRVSGDKQDSIAWLRLDDMKKNRAGRGFVERIDSVSDADRLFSEDLGLHSYMLFYELVPLNLDDEDKAQIKTKCALIETQPDYELALQLELIERAGAEAGMRQEGAERGSASTCFVS